MNTALTLNDIYSMLAGLSLSNKQLLAERLISDVVNTKQRQNAKQLVFPHIAAKRSVSKQVLEMTVGALPDDFDVEKEMTQMWEERAK